MKEYKVKSGKRKGSWVYVQRKPGPSFQESCPSGATQGMLNSPSDLWQLWNVVYQGTSLETWCQKLFVGANDIGIICLAVNKILIPRRKAGVQQKSCSLHSLDQGTTIQISRCQPCKQAFRDTLRACFVNSFLYTIRPKIFN